MQIVTDTGPAGMLIFQSKLIGSLLENCLEIEQRPSIAVLRVRNASSTMVPADI
jgi:hypothetical protein